MTINSGYEQGSQMADPALLRKRRKTIGLVSVALLALILVLFLWKGSGDDAVPADGDVSVAHVTVIVPQTTSVSSVINAVGSLAARREMPVGAVGEGGQVSAVLVEAGDWVKAGQVLAVVERSVQTQQQASLVANIRVAEADARLAQSELERAQALVARGFISKADIERKTATRDAAAARVQVARAQAQENRALIGRLDIRAPADGLVLSRAVEPGQVVSAGSAVLFRIAKGGQMEMLARVSEADMMRLSVGARATVTPVGSTQSYGGEIWQLSPIIDAQSRQGDARIALSYHKDIRPGGFAAAQIVSSMATTPVLPESAVQNDDKGSYVYIVNAKDVVERRNVKVGQVSSAGVSVTDGLTGQEKVVVLAGGFLNPGQKVKPEIQKPDKPVNGAASSSPADGTGK
ncbi:MAG: efflux RND transporter periplasmic adaptor subunit [Sphingobium sp.]|nr:efflux RND transporter periplasmic adaptor subunit [Sphingobium sp.]